MYDIFYISKEKDSKFFDLQKKIPLLKIAKYENNVSEGFFSAKKKALSKFYWVISEGFDINKDFNFNYSVPEWDSKYVHIFKQNNGINGGLYLIPKDYSITKKEADYNFFVNKKDIDIIFGSQPPFEKFTISKPEDYFEAQRICKTSMFYAIPEDYKIIDNFEFSIPEWDKKYVHMFKTNGQETGIVNLIPRDYPITKKEAEYSFFINKKIIDKNISKPNYDRFIISKPEDYYEAQKACKTSMFYAIDVDYEPIFDFMFSVPAYDKKYVHIFKKTDGVLGGIFLIPRDYPITKKEVEFSFFINKKELDIVASKLNYDRFIISKPEDYYEAQKACKTSMFYAIDVDYEPTFNFDYVVSDFDKKYFHIFKKVDRTSGGVYLISKNYPITKKEAEFSFFVNKKEIDIVASKPNYDRFIISKPEDYYEAQKACKTSMFYAINRDYTPIFDFDYVVSEFDKKYINVFKTNVNENGEVYLIPKNYPITKKEAEFSFFINKKELDIVASKLQFDIVFVSYNEPNADENYEKLLKRFPYAQRVHGVKGIHQAHIAAAKKAKTTMFWAVDGDAIIEDNFKFYLDVPKWDRDAVHVFRSRNPINDLVYGYGGVKLLPTNLVLELDVNTIDMTTSISKKFISVNEVSNITAFNTDPFSTWKSAFRECVKLSSKVIDGQVDEETQYRLNVWQSVGADRLFGEYSIAGAKLGYEFGTIYSGEKEMLERINDWEWLENVFRQ